MKTKLKGNKSSHRMSVAEIKQYKILARNARFALNRFEPKIKSVTKELMTGALPENAFPSVAENAGGNTGCQPHSIPACQLQL